VAVIVTHHRPCCCSATAVAAVCCCLICAFKSSHFFFYAFAVAVTVNAKRVVTAVYSCCRCHCYCTATQRCCYCRKKPLLLLHNAAATAAQRRCYCRTTPLLRRTTPLPSDFPVRCRFDAIAVRQLHFPHLLPLVNCLHQLSLLFVIVIVAV